MVKYWVALRTFLFLLLRWDDGDGVLQEELLQLHVLEADYVLRVVVPLLLLLLLLLHRDLYVEVLLLLLLLLLLGQ